MFLEKVFHLVCCVSCRMLYSFVVYLYVSGSGSITSVGEERANLLMLFTCYCGIFFRSVFLFLWVLGTGYFNLFWHSLSLPYNYYGVASTSDSTNLKT